MTNDLKISFSNQDVFFANLEYDSKNMSNESNNDESINSVDHFDEQFCLILNALDSTGDLTKEYTKYRDKIFFFKSFMQVLKLFHDEFLEINFYSLHKNIAQKKKVLIKEQSVYDFKYIIKIDQDFLIFTNRK